jgi:uncharacterized metal-binding protein YceD (DUF177 family)
VNDIAFSRPLRVDPLPRGGLAQEIEATAAERERLAALNGLVGIARLSARFTVSKWRRGVHVEGELSARVTHTCVVSLEPFDVDIDEPINVNFLPANAGAPPPESRTLSVDDDEPDELIDGKIDLGALASEFLTLSLDPYPRKPGVAFEPPSPDGARDSPFERLRVLSDREEPD